MQERCNSSALAMEWCLSCTNPVISYLVKFSWPNDTVWYTKSYSTLVQVMALCPLAPSHYLNRCRLSISIIQHFLRLMVVMHSHFLGDDELTHGGQVTHICVNKIKHHCSYNGLLPGRRQVIIWASAGILLIWSLGTNFSEILIEIHTFPFKKMYLKMLSGKW